MKLNIGLLFSMLYQSPWANSGWGNNSSTPNTWANSPWGNSSTPAWSNAWNDSGVGTWRDSPTWKDSVVWTNAPWSNQAPDVTSPVWKNTGTTTPTLPVWSNAPGVVPVPTWMDTSKPVVQPPIVVPSPVVAPTPVSLPPGQNPFLDPFNVGWKDIIPTFGTTPYVAPVPGKLRPPEYYSPPVVTPKPTPSYQPPMEMGIGSGFGGIATNIYDRVKNIFGGTPTTKAPVDMSNWPSMESITGMKPPSLVGTGRPTTPEEMANIFGRSSETAPVRFSSEAVKQRAIEIANKAEAGFNLWSVPTKEEISRNKAVESMFGGIKKAGLPTSITNPFAGKTAPEQQYYYVDYGKTRTKYIYDPNKPFIESVFGTEQKIEPGMSYRKDILGSINQGVPIERAMTAIKVAPQTARNMQTIWEVGQVLNPIGFASSPLRTAGVSLPRVPIGVSRAVEALPGFKYVKSGFEYLTPRSVPITGAKQDIKLASTFEEQARVLRGAEIRTIEQPTGARTHFDILTDVVPGEKLSLQERRMYELVKNQPERMFDVNIKQTTQQFGLTEEFAGTGRLTLTRPQPTINENVIARNLMGEPIGSGVVPKTPKMGEVGRVPTISDIKINQDIKPFNVRPLESFGQEYVTPKVSKEFIEKYPTGLEKLAPEDFGMFREVMKPVEGKMGIDTSLLDVKLGSEEMLKGFGGGRTNTLTGRILIKENLPVDITADIYGHEVIHNVVKGAGGKYPRVIKEAIAQKGESIFSKTFKDIYGIEDVGGLGHTGVSSIASKAVPEKMIKPMDMFKLNPEARKPIKLDVELPYESKGTLTNIFEAKKPVEIVPDYLKEMAKKNRISELGEPTTQLAFEKKGKPQFPDSTLTTHYLGKESETGKIIQTRTVTPPAKIKPLTSFDKIMESLKPDKLISYKSTGYKVKSAVGKVKSGFKDFLTSESGSLSPIGESRTSQVSQAVSRKAGRGKVVEETPRNVLDIQNVKTGQKYERVPNWKEVNKQYEMQSGQVTNKLIRDVFSTGISLGSVARPRSVSGREVGYATGGFTPIMPSIDNVRGQGSQVGGIKSGVGNDFGTIYQPISGIGGKVRTIFAPNYPPSTGVKPIISPIEVPGITTPITRTRPITSPINYPGMTRPRQDQTLWADAGQQIHWMDAPPKMWQDAPVLPPFKPFDTYKPPTPAKFIPPLMGGSSGAGGGGGGKGFFGHTKEHPIEYDILGKQVQEAPRKKAPQMMHNIELPFSGSQGKVNSPATGKAKPQRAIMPFSGQGQAKAGRVKLQRNMMPSVGQQVVNEAFGMDKKERKIKVDR